MEQIDFVKGIVIGGCVGSVMSLLLAPKSGKELRHDIIDGYNAINEQTQEYAEEVKEQAQSFMDSFQSTEHEYRALILGCLSGAVIGTLAALLLAPQSGRNLRRQLGEKYEEILEKAEHAVNGIHRTSENKIEEWKDTFVTILDKLTSPKNKKFHATHSGIGEIVEWANLGLRLYNQLQERR